MHELVLVNRIGILPTLDKRAQGKTGENVLTVRKLLNMEDYGFEAIARACAEDLQAAA